ncbi:substrate-binding periplasmic protein [Porticoccus hydrocarbonoclasticus]|uniref:substrate-binding periplasmic protein n=1 Tax=Porticoccus hydrocarbonoclasticus TaxID=1073414 RepID=UPI001267A389|nr:transporter substrate-binding domain-containing protein [Porticoccus hydrocarbonoclasticus]|tara:strand:+ start:2544 stop:3584 length:1041 start_codon:yes stop_codon:yes gene_type:complete
MRFSNCVKSALLCSLLLSGLVAAGPFTAVEVYTDAWPPYVNREPDKEPGAITRIVELALRNMRLDPQWQRVDFSLAYEMVNNNEIRLSFPYFETARRKQLYPDVRFSAPLMTVDNVLYYSREHWDFSSPPDSIGDLRLGRVAEYAYGEKFEAWLVGATEYQSEVLALRALFNGDIDLLPMARRVGQALVLEYFPWQYRSFRHIPGDDYLSQDTVHLVTHDDPQGEAFIKAFDEALEKLAGVKKQDEVWETSLDAGRSTGYVRLVVGEGHPVIIGQTQRQGEHPDNHYVMIPPGSRGLVLDWSDAVFKEFNSPKLYAAMVALSKIRIVDGPHVGRELYVKNLHIEIE